MRLAAVDFGRRRIGLAVCDPLGIAVRGLDTVTAGPDEAATVATVAKALAAEGGVERVVVGVALRGDGSESESSLAARRFGAALSAALGRDVVFFDEALTSWEAEETLKERGRDLRSARRSGEVDRAAAVGILRSYLRHLESGGA